jgi:DNA ligase-4
MREVRLVKVLARIWNLPSRCIKPLQEWKTAKTDFATVVEQVMAEFDAYVPAETQVTLEEIDQALLQLAANSGFSSPDISKQKNSIQSHDILCSIVRRLQSHQLKWLVRMILKDYRPIQIPERTVLRCFHFLLPELLAVQNSIDAAVAVLGHPQLKSLPPNPEPDYMPVLLGLCAQHLTPKLGNKITRTPYVKARSIKHCCNEARGRSMSVERKYDGEYCQIHVDLSNSRDQIKIFSKSGKDSTNDRVRLHGAVKAGLRIGELECAFSKNCIVEGELLVYSRSKEAILPFHTIRKHVMHGGRFLGAAEDSPRKPDEQLMFVFYDVLLLDDEALTSKPQCQRRQQLERIVRHIEGEAELGYQRNINFGSTHGKEELRSFFAHAINQRWEGFVLKGCNDPYFSWDKSKSVIKLKKDYIKGCGDTVDLCIIGGQRDQAVVEELRMGPLSWTTFYTACLENKEEVRRFDAKPVFRILDTVSPPGISKDEIIHLNAHGKYLEVPFATSTDHLDVRITQTGIAMPTELFKKPFVVEVMGAGFERPQNARYFVPRFPRASIKLHSDRSILETSSFEEFQEQAQKSMEVALDQEEQDELEWVQRLVAADGKNARLEEESQSTPSHAQTTPRSLAGGHAESTVSPSPHSRGQTDEYQSHGNDTPSKMPRAVMANTQWVSTASPTPQTPGFLIDYYLQTADTPFQKRDQQVAPLDGVSSPIANPESVSTATPTPGAIFDQRFHTRATPCRSSPVFIVIEDTPSTASPSRSSQCALSPLGGPAGRFAPSVRKDTRNIVVAEQTIACHGTVNVRKLNAESPAKGTSKRKIADTTFVSEASPPRKRQRMLAPVDERENVASQTAPKRKLADTIFAIETGPGTKNQRMSAVADSVGSAAPDGVSKRTLLAEALSSSKRRKTSEAPLDESLAGASATIWNAATAHVNKQQIPTTTSATRGQSGTAREATPLILDIETPVPAVQAQPQSSLPKSPHWHPPFEPAAVFRTPAKPTTKTKLTSQLVGVTPPRRERHPLSQVSTISSQRGAKKLPVDLTEADASDKENSSRREASMQSGHDSATNLSKRKALARKVSGSRLSRGGNVQPQNTRLPEKPPSSSAPGSGVSGYRDATTSKLDPSADEFAKKVLGSYCMPIEREKPHPSIVTTESAALKRPSLDSLLFVRLVDRSRPSETSRDVQQVGRRVLELHRELISRRAGQVTHGIAASSMGKQQKLVMFYDEGARPFLPAEDSICKCDGSANCQSCLKLLDPVLRPYFVAALVFSSRGNVHLPVTLEKGAKTLQDAPEPPAQGQENQDNNPMVADVVWDWQEAINILPNSRSKG